MHGHPTSPAYCALLFPHLLAQLLLARPFLCYSLPSEVRSLMRCSLYKPLFSSLSTRLLTASAHLPAPT
jgi:hypothetical protein